MALRSVVRLLTALIAFCGLASAGSLVFITDYLHRLTVQIDANLQSVRAAEEIELQLLRHARNLNQASLMSAPALAVAASEAQLEVLRWLETARQYVGSNDEAAILAKLEKELDVYFAEPSSRRPVSQPSSDMRKRPHSSTWHTISRSSLRNPLAAMKAAIQVIRARNAGTVSERGDLTAVISRHIDLLVRMLSDLLDSARIESGQLELVTADQDARDLVLDAVALFQQAAPLHEFAVRVPESVLPVVCDGERMSQVINNVLGNAIKYSPQGGRVEARAREHASGVTIEIADKGIGISAEECAVIFEPFRRAQNPGWAIPGVGIGLSVARRIVEAHGGRITVHSVVGAGSTFSIWVPRQPAPSAAPPH